MRRDPRAGDRRAAGAAVRLEDVAVEPERPLAERLEVEHRADAAADQALDLDRPPLLLAACAPPARCDRRSRPGSSEYSAVSQPRPRPAIQRGTPCSSVAVQSTRVLPAEKSTEPCGCSRKSTSRSSGRSWSGLRPSLRAHAAGSQLGERDLLDLGDRQLEEAPPVDAERAPGRRS